MMKNFCINMSKFIIFIVILIVVFTSSITTQIIAERKASNQHEISLNNYNNEMAFTSLSNNQRMINGYALNDIQQMLNVGVGIYQDFRVHNDDGV